MICRVMLVLAILLLPVTASASSAAQLWVKAKCALCHAKDGSGNTDTGRKLKVRDLRLPEVQKLSDDEMTKAVQGGHDRMPGFKSQTSEAEVRLLVTRIRDLAKSAKK